MKIKRKIVFLETDDKNSVSISEEKEEILTSEIRKQNSVSVSEKKEKIHISETKKQNAVFTSKTAEEITYENVNDLMSTNLQRNNKIQRYLEKKLCSSMTSYKEKEAVMNALDFFNYYSGLNNNHLK